MANGGEAARPRPAHDDGIGHKAQPQRGETEKIPSMWPDFPPDGEDEARSAARPGRKGPRQSLDHEAEPQGPHGQIHAGQAHEDLRHRAGERKGQNKADQQACGQGQAELLEDPAHIPGQAHEGRLPEGEHAQHAEDQVQADG